MFLSPSLPLLSSFFLVTQLPSSLTSSRPTPPPQSHYYIMLNKRQKKEDIVVQLGENSYPITFTPLPEVGALLKGKFSPTKVVLISNSVVCKLKHKDVVLTSLQQAFGKDQVYYLEIEDGEAKKTAETYLWLVDQLLSIPVDRKAMLVGLGGGK